jgi:hypothetical protein
MEMHPEQTISEGQGALPHPQPLESNGTQSHMTTDMHQPMTNDMYQPTINDTHQPVASDMQQPMTSDAMQQPMVSDTMSPQMPNEALQPHPSNEAMLPHTPNDSMLPHLPSEGMQQPVSDHHEAQKHMDQTMDVDDSNNTITAASVNPMPNFHPNNNVYAQNNNGYPQNSNSPAQEPHRPSTSYSDTAYQYTTHNGSRFNTSSDADTPPRHGYYDASRETHMGQSHSRPNSQMGRYPVSEGGSRANSYQDQTRSTQQQQQQTPPEAASKNASVVIKVGMVGDAQIGKTSLMVKYVEGSWDEDYIQTLGKDTLSFVATLADRYRCQLHGEDHFDQEHRNHILHLGSRWPARVRKHVALGLQRCCGHTVHVRPDAEEHTELHQGVVPPRTWLQQDSDTILGRHKVRSLCQLSS